MISAWIKRSGYRKQNWSLLIFFMGICVPLRAQIPVEIFGGNERSTVDIMFFKYFQKAEGERTRWLFFNRNRASVDYRITETTYLPQFGFTEAISYNHPKFMGFAPVAVAQVLSWGVFPKAGIQYARIKGNTTLFTWFVYETMKEPDLDLFLLYRYTPELTDRLNLFAQIESLNTFPSAAGGMRSFTQRFRLGLKWRTYQFGTGADLQQSGVAPFSRSSNIGAFVRCEF